MGFRLIYYAAAEMLTMEMVGESVKENEQVCVCVCVRKRTRERKKNSKITRVGRGAREGSSEEKIGRHLAVRNACRLFPNCVFKLRLPKMNAFPSSFSLKLI